MQTEAKNEYAAALATRSFSEPETKKRQKTPICIYQYSIIQRKLILDIIRKVQRKLKHHQETQAPPPSPPPPPPWLQDPPYNTIQWDTCPYFYVYHMQLPATCTICMCIQGSSIKNNTHVSPEARLVLRCRSTCFRDYGDLAINRIVYLEMLTRKEHPWNGNAHTNLRSPESGTSLATSKKGVNAPDFRAKEASRLFVHLYSIWTLSVQM